MTRPLHHQPPKFTREGVRQLVQHIDSLLARDPQLRTHKALLTAAKAFPPRISSDQQRNFLINFSKWKAAQLNNRSTPKWQWIGEECFNKILRYLVDSGKWLGTDHFRTIEKHFPSPLFHALAAQLSMDDLQIGELKKMFLGTYAVWRPCIDDRRKVWLGRMTVSFNEQARSLDTLETYAVSNANGEIDRHEWKGHLLKAANHYVLISIKTDRPWLQTVYIPELQKLPSENVNSMYGFLAGTHAVWSYASRIYFMRCNHESSAPTLDKVDFADESLVPLPALDRLCRRFSLPETRPAPQLIVDTLPFPS